MALFSKPPIKKFVPPAAKPAAAAPDKQVSARELTARAGNTKDKPRLEPVYAEESITNASLIEWSPQQQAIEVAQANPGLCAVLENAALLYATGQTQGARTLLEQGVIGDYDTRQSSLAWLALFDVLQRAGDRDAFDQLALQYSVQFERSAPGWEGKLVAPVIKAGGGYLPINGKLTAQSGPQLEGVRRAIAKHAAQVRLDLSALTGFDDAGAKLLANALAEARRAKLAISIERSQKLNALLDAAVKRGREGGEGAWLLSLELLLWVHDQATFDDRAIEYAMAFEMSPPSWEPPPLSMVPLDPAPPTGIASQTPQEVADTVVLEGVLAGNVPQVGMVSDFAHGRQVVPVDMTAVNRIDFVCAGALLNVVNRVEGQRKTVQILGASPIIRALLLLIGLSPRHFLVKKTG